MADPTPEEIAAAALLAHTKQVTRERVVSHMNGVGASLVNHYPMAEEKSWPIQRPEAFMVLQLPEATVLGKTLLQLQDLAPFLVDVCIAHFGPDATDAERAAQLWAKATAVKANAIAWAQLSAFVNGLRARMEDRLAGAGTVEAIFTIESETQTELTAFRDEHSV